jgi:hypothetical protein
VKTPIHFERAGAVLLLVLGLLALAVVVQAAWNMVVPGVFGLAALRYPQAVALLVLAGVAAGWLRFSMRAGPQHAGE